jgi:hypothetical protein
MSASTLFTALERIPDHRPGRALGHLVSTDGGLGHVAIDGKRLRGSQHETSPGVHMLHAFSTKLQAAVGSLVVPPDSGEVIEALELIKSLPLEGAVVTGDAAFTFKRIVEAIRKKGGDCCRTPTGWRWRSH